MPGTNPIFPAIGSTIIAARSSFTELYISIKASASLYGQVIVSFANSAGIPGESGNQKVDTPNGEAFLGLNLYRK